MVFMSLCLQRWVRSLETDRFFAIVAVSYLLNVGMTLGVRDFVDYAVDLLFAGESWLRPLFVDGTVL